MSGRISLQSGDECSKGGTGAVNKREKKSHPKQPCCLGCDVGVGGALGECEVEISHVWQVYAQGLETLWTC